MFDRIGLLGMMQWRIFSRIQLCVNVILQCASSASSKSSYKCISK